MEFGGEHRVDRCGARRDVIDCDSNFGGFSVGLAGHAHEPANALRHDVEPWPVAVRPGLAETTDGAVEDVVAHPADRLIVDAETACDARPEVLDHQVGAGSELKEELTAAVGLEVDGN